MQRSYVDAYRSPEMLAAGLAYYRTGAEDIAALARVRECPIATPVLAVGGRYAMGTAVADGIRPLATDVRGIVLERSGHYPIEQEPGPAGRAVVEFLTLHADR